MTENPSPPRTLKEDIQDLKMWARYEGPFTERYPATRNRVDRLINAYQNLETDCDALREQNKALEESLEKMTEDRERWANSACRLEKTIEQRDRWEEVLKKIRQIANTGHAHPEMTEIEIIAQAALHSEEKV